MWPKSLRMRILFQRFLLGGVLLQFVIYSPPYHIWRAPWCGSSGWLFPPWASSTPLLDLWWTSELIKYFHIQHLVWPAEQPIGMAVTVITTVLQKLQLKWNDLPEVIPLKSVLRPLAWCPFHRPTLYNHRSVSSAGPRVFEAWTHTCFLHNTGAWAIGLPCLSSEGYLTRGMGSWGWEGWN